MADLTIVRDGTDHFSVAGSRREAARYTIKVKLRGGAGVVAKVLDKQPPDHHVWILLGEAPVFLRSEGPLYNGGAGWRPGPPGPGGRRKPPQAPQGSLPSWPRRGWLFPGRPFPR